MFGMVSFLPGSFPHGISPFSLDQVSHMAARSHGEGLELGQKHFCCPLVTQASPKVGFHSSNGDVTPPSLALHV